VISLAAIGGHGHGRPRRTRASHALLKASIVAAVLNLHGVLAVHAQTFVTPFIAYDVGADSRCLNLLVCADRSVNVGATAGRMAKTLGFEEEVAYAKDFFGSAPNLSSSVLTVMSNVIVAPHIRDWKLFAVGGVGLLKTHIQFTEASFYATDRNNLEWDVGGGLIVPVGRRFGVRVDYRYFRGFRDVPLSGFTVSDSKLGFGRASAGLVVGF
jgi:hypothetical protein